MISLRNSLVAICACVTLTTVTANTRVISNPATADFDFFTALNDGTVDEVVLQVDVALLNSPQLGHTIRRHLTIRGEQCAGQKGRCHIRIGGTSTFPKRGFFLTDAAHLTLHDVTVSGGLPLNDAVYGSSGGAFFLEKGSCLTAVNCEISGNDAGRGSGGAVYLSTEASFTCLGCDIVGNKAKRGGSVFASGSKYVSAKFQNTEFNSNAAVNVGVGSAEGGVIYTGGNGVVEFTNVTFDRNRSAGTGGVAHFLGGVGYFNNIVWKMNSASSRLFGPLIFVEDVAKIYGNGWTNATAEIELCCVPGTFFPLVVKSRPGDLNQVTTEFTATLRVVENMYCPADRLIPPPPPSPPALSPRPPLSPPSWPPGTMLPPSPKGAKSSTPGGSGGGSSTTEETIFIVVGAALLAIFLTVAGCACYKHNNANEVEEVFPRDPEDFSRLPQKSSKIMLDISQSQKSLKSTDGSTEMQLFSPSAKLEPPTKFRAISPSIHHFSSIDDETVII
eukprot:1185960-Prorocentrum_minimum.AAC.1